MNNEIPIAYIVFNRPFHTKQSFEVLKNLKPKKLFIIADGPRTNFPKDKNLCKMVREIVEHVEWECEVRYNFSDKNMGLKNRVSSGIDWVFDHCDKAIILEDDCIPNPEFFNFCDCLLARYKNNDKISVITGNNFFKITDRIQCILTILLSLIIVGDGQLGKELGKTTTVTLVSGQGGRNLHTGQIIFWIKQKKSIGIIFLN